MATPLAIMGTNYAGKIAAFKEEKLRNISIVLE